MDLHLNKKNEAVMSQADIDILKKKGAGALQVKVSHILVSGAPIADEIYNEIMKATDHKKEFENQAKKHSSCPSKQNGGDLGWFGMGQMVPEFETASFDMTPGEVRTGIVTQFGTHILYKEDERLLLPIKSAE